MDPLMSEIPYRPVLPVLQVFHMDFLGRFYGQIGGWYPSCGDARYIIPAADQLYFILSTTIIKIDHLPETICIFVGITFQYVSFFRKYKTSAQQTGQDPA